MAKQLCIKRTWRDFLIFSSPLWLDLIFAQNCFFIYSNIFTVKLTVLRRGIDAMFFWWFSDFYPHVYYYPFISPIFHFVGVMEGNEIMNERDFQFLRQRIKNVFMATISSNFMDHWSVVIETFAGKTTLVIWWPSFAIFVCIVYARNLIETSVIKQASKRPRISNVNSATLNTAMFSFEATQWFDFEPTG